MEERVTQLAVVCNSAKSEWESSLDYKRDTIPKKSDLIPFIAYFIYTLVLLLSALKLMLGLQSYADLFRSKYQWTF